MTTGIKSLKVQIRTITLKYLTVRKVIYWFIAIVINVNRFSVLFSQWIRVTIPWRVCFFWSWHFHGLTQSLRWTRQRFKAPRHRHMIYIGKIRICEIGLRCYEYVRLKNVIVWKGINIPSILKYLEWHQSNCLVTISQLLWCKRSFFSLNRNKTFLDRNRMKCFLTQNWSAQTTTVPYIFQVGNSYSI